MIEQPRIIQFSIKSRRMIVAVAVAVVLIGMGVFTHQIAYGMAFALLASLMGAFTIDIRSDIAYPISQIIWVILTAFTMCYAIQYFLEVNNVFNIGWFGIVMNMVVIAIVFCLFMLITRRHRLSLLLTMIILLSLSVGNYFVYIFRGNELMPLDLLSVGTAMNVVGGYTISLTPKMAVGFSMCIDAFLFGGVFKSDHQKARRLPTFCLLVALMIAWGIGGNSLTMRTWQNMGTKQNGYLMNFTLLLKSEMMTGKPKGYSASVIEDIEKDYRTTIQEEEDLPDVIAIMNESFADLNVLGHLNTQTEVMPFFHSLKDNTIKGYALSSVFGGGTANSEFEFLTGHSIANVPMGATAYQLYINKPMHSMVEDMKSLGYYCTATHPYLASGWSRSKVYPLLGFDEATFIDDYPRDDLVRGFVSDREMYAYMIDKYQNKGNKKLFAFGVTMQNHGGYTYSGTGYTPQLKLDGYKGDYSDVEQYLGLMRESDEAFAYLINYFKQVDHKVIVVMFGDHLPKLNTAFYHELHGGDYDGLDEEELQYKIPFVVWTNYDINEQEVECSSINYLSNYVYEAMGINKPAYNAFLDDLSKVIPSMNAQGYYSLTKGCFLAYSEADQEEKKWLQKYRYLQYNGLFDHKHRSTIFFPLHNDKGE